MDKRIKAFRLRPDLSRLNRRGPQALVVGEAQHDLRAARNTAKQWIQDPSKIGKVNLNLLGRLLIKVYGLDPQEVMDLPLGEVFRLEQMEESHEKDLA